MTAPTVATLFQIGLDNALIQVPQNYTVPANPPSMPNPPNNLAIPTNNTQITTTSDSVTIYLSAIKGFSNQLYMSFLIQPISVAVAAELGYTLDPVDGTSAPWLGEIGSTDFNWLTGTYNSGAGGWVGPLPFSMQPNNGNALNTYVVQNYQTLWINPGLTGGAINPSHPPSYLVTIYALDPVTNTYAACNFTLVVMPSVANYGLGVYTIAHVGPSFSQNVGYVNSVTLQSNGFSLSPKSAAVLNYFFYPLEPASEAPANINIQVNWFNSPIIDTTNSMIATPASSYTPVAFGSFSNADGLAAITAPFTRDSQPSGFDPYTGSYPLAVELYLNSTADASSTTAVNRHALLQILATDTNGVTVSAYTAIYVAGEATA